MKVLLLRRKFMFFFTWLLFVKVSFAQQAEPLELAPVEVTAANIPLTLQQTARSVVVLSKEQISKLPVQTVNDLLKLASGVDVRQRGYFGMQTDISIRGGNYSQVAVLLNGINITDPQTGHNSMEIPIDMSQVERIEILQGPAGRTYGASSLVGAINIITKKHHSTGAEVALKAGSYGYTHLQGEAHFANDKLSNSVSASYGRADGFTRSKKGALNNDFRTHKFFYNGRYTAENVSLNWFGGYAHKAFGANTFYSTRSDEQFERIGKWFSGVDAKEIVGHIHLNGTAYWHRFYDEFDFYGRNYQIKPDTLGNFPKTKPAVNHHRTDAYGVRFTSYIQTLLGKTSWGFNMRGEEVLSTKLGEERHNPLSVRRDPTATYTQGLSRSTFGLHLEHNVQIENLSVSAGVIALKHSWNEMPTKLYPGIDAVYNIKGWRLSASYNTSLRLPDFTELYYTDPERKANKYLQAEELEAFEGGIGYSTAGLKLQTNVFYNKGRNFIDWIRPLNTPTAPWQSVNYAKINTMGWETNFSFNLNELLPQQQFLQQFSVSYHRLWQVQEENTQLRSGYSLNYLPHKLTAWLLFQPAKNLWWNLAYRYQERYGYYTMNDASHKFAPYGLVDSRIVWKKTTYSLFFEVNNVFNKTYFDFADVPQIGCHFTVGGSYVF